jgi:cytochrome c-type biogenesis protein
MAHQRVLIQVLGAVTIVLGLLLTGALDRFSSPAGCSARRCGPEPGWPAPRGALLASVYAVGIGIPFSGVAVAVRCGMAGFALARRHARLITRAGGLLIAVGLLQVTGKWATALTWPRGHWIGGYELPL